MSCLCQSAYLSVIALGFWVITRVSLHSKVTRLRTHKALKGVCPVWQRACYFSYTRCTTLIANSAKSHNNSYMRFSLVPTATPLQCIVDTVHPWGSLVSSTVQCFCYTQGQLACTFSHHVITFGVLCLMLCSLRQVATAVVGMEVRLLGMVPVVVAMLAIDNSTCNTVCHH